MVNYAKDAVNEIAYDVAVAGYDGINWAQAAEVDWSALAQDYANGKGRAISAYFPASRIAVDVAA